MSDFNRQVFSSLRWAATGRFASQIVTWAITIVVIRILTPEDYGLMAIASIFVGILAVFENLGMAAAVIRRESIPDSFLRDIFGAIILVSSLVYGILYFAAPGIGLFFDEPELPRVVRVLALSVIVSALGALPMSIIERNLRFKERSIVTFVAAITGSVATLLMALGGLSVWALVFGTLITSSIQTVGFWLVIGKLFIPTLRLTRVFGEIKFGSYVTLDRLIWIVYSQADIFIVGKMLGTEAVGLYSVALQIATLPMQKIAGIMNQVGYAAFSKIHSDLALTRRNLLRAVELIAVIAFPVFFGISVVAEPLVDGVLGTKWAEIAAPLAVMALAVPLRMINTTTPTLLFALGKARVAAQNSALALIVFVPAFILAAGSGSLVYVSLVWVIVYPVYLLICLKRALPNLHVSIREYMTFIWKPALMAGIMYLVVISARYSLAPASVGKIVELISSIAIGATVYTVLMWRYQRDNVVSVWRVIRG